MAASGLSTTDAVRPELFGGLVVEFISLVRSEYQRVFAHDAAQLKMTRDGWYYEPSVAEHAFARLLEAEQKQLRWLPGTHLTGATVSGGRVRSVEIEDARGVRSTITARTYIDGTYEGDLAGAAKVPYRVGREGRGRVRRAFGGHPLHELADGQEDPDARYRRAFARDPGLLRAFDFHRRPGRARRDREAPPPTTSTCRISFHCSTILPPAV